MTKENGKFNFEELKETVENSRRSKVRFENFGVFETGFPFLDTSVTMSNNTGVPSGSVIEVRSEPGLGGYALMCDVANGLYQNYKLDIDYPQVHMYMCENDETRWGVDYKSKEFLAMKSMYELEWGCNVSKCQPKTDNISDEHLLEYFELVCKYKRETLDEYKIEARDMWGHNGEIIAPSIFIMDNLNRLNIETDIDDMSLEMVARKQRHLEILNKMMNMKKDLNIIILFHTHINREFSIGIKPNQRLYSLIGKTNVTLGDTADYTIVLKNSLTNPENVEDGYNNRVVEGGLIKNKFSNYFPKFHLLIGNRGFQPYTMETEKVKDILRENEILKEKINKLKREVDNI